MTPLEQLTTRLATLKVTPFVGAGLSCKVDLPSWKSVIHEMATILGIEVDQPYPRIAQQYEDRFSRDGLIGLLTKLLGSQAVNMEKLDVHHLFLDFPFVDIFTTNQDLVLEQALLHVGRHHHSIKRHSDLRTALPLLARRIVKFHGDIDSPEEVVFTSSDYDRRMAQPGWQDIYLAGRLIENCVLFVGYGLGDQNVLLVWEQIRKVSSPNCPPEAFRLFDRHDEAEFSRMAALDIQSVLVEVKDRSNPVELIEWLSAIRQQVAVQAFEASEEYLFKGKVAPAQTLTKGLFDSLEKMLQAGDDPDERLHEFLFSKQIPDYLLKPAEELLVQHVAKFRDFMWPLRLAQRYKMTDLALAILSALDATDKQLDGIRLSPITTLHMHFDDWSLSTIVAHLEKVEPKRNAHDPKHHVVDIFGSLKHAGIEENDKITADTKARFDAIRERYFKAFSVIKARWNMATFKSRGPRDILKQMQDHMAGSKSAAVSASRLASRVEPDTKDRFSG